MFTDKTRSSYLCKMSCYEVDQEDPTKLTPLDIEFIVIAWNFDKARNKTKVMTGKLDTSIYREIVLHTIERMEEVVYF